jgi:arylsulfatase A-like enzyme
MKELWDAQQAGGDLPPHESSQQAAALPDPPYPLTAFPGHAAWIHGQWKLHRIENNRGAVQWELYNLTADPGEQNDLMQSETERVQQLRSELEEWLKSVVRSLNGADYGRSAN